MPFLSDHPPVITFVSPSWVSSHTYPQINHTNPINPTMPTTTLPTNSTTNTTSTAKSNATKSSPLPIVIEDSRYANAMGSDQMYMKRHEDQHIIFEHLSMKDAYGNYKPGSVHANENTIVFNKSDFRCAKSDAGSDMAVRYDRNQISEWKKDGDGKEQRTSMQNLQRSRLGGGEVLGNTSQWMTKGSSQDPTTQQYHLPQIDGFERQTSAFRYGAASPTHPKQCAYLNIKPSVSNVAFADSPNPLNAGNLNILNQQNKLSSLKPPASLALSTSPAHSIASARATCSYEEIDNKTVRVKGSVAAVALTIATANAAAAAAGNKEEPGCEHADGKSKDHITWGVVDTTTDHEVPNWELIDEVDAIEEWNAIDIVDRTTFTREVEGWSLL